MLLRGPALFNNNKGIKEKLEFKVLPRHALKKCKDKAFCCHCDKTPNCDCVCDCYGYFDTTSDGWDYDPQQMPLPKFEPGHIKILYRDRIKVFYSKVKYGVEDGYTEFRKDIYNNPNGYLYSFTGLRGDAKQLY